MHNMHTTFSRHFFSGAHLKKQCLEKREIHHGMLVSKVTFEKGAHLKKEVCRESGVLVRISFTKGLVKLISLHHHLHHRGKRKYIIMIIIISTYLLQIVSQQVVIVFLFVLLRYRLYVRVYRY